MSKTFFRWLKFNTVGAAGMVIHFGLLAFLVHVVRLHYLAATPIAIEAAVFQNFLWHRRWTWADRPIQGWSQTCAALLRFNLTNGAVSLAGYMASAWLFTSLWGIDPVFANALGLIPCGLANFFLADWLVFPTPV
jgi:putative flippase GtrA